MNSLALLRIFRTSRRLKIVRCWWRRKILWRFIKGVFPSLSSYCAFSHKWFYSPLIPLSVSCSIFFSSYLFSTHKLYLIIILLEQNFLRMYLVLDPVKSSVNATTQLKSRKILSRVMSTLVKICAVCAIKIYECERVRRTKTTLIKYFFMAHIAHNANFYYNNVMSVDRCGAHTL